MNRRYLLCGLDRLEVARLEGAQIPLEKLPEPDSGVIVQGSHLLYRAAKVLDRWIARERDEGQVVAVSFGSRETSPDVCARGQSRLGEIAREVLLPALRRPIQIEVCNNRLLEPEPKSEKFWVYLNAGFASTAVPGILFPTMYWGYPRADRYKTERRPIQSLRGELICCYNGWPLAEILGPCVAVFQDFSYDGYGDNVPIMREIFRVVVQRLTEDPSEREAKALVYLDGVKRQAESSWRQLIYACLKKQKRAVEAVLESEKTIRSERLDAVSQAARSIPVLEMALAVEEGLSYEVIAKPLEEVFKAMLELEHVRSVDADGEKQCIVLITDCIPCPNPRDQTIRAMGRFKIEIYPDGSHGGVRWFCLEEDNPLAGADCLPFSGLQAPFVHADGRALVSPVQDAITELIGRERWLDLARVSIGHLKYADPNHPNCELMDLYPIYQAL